MPRQTNTALAPRVKPIHGGAFYKKSMENQTAWKPVIEAFAAVKTEGRDNADIMKEYETLRQQFKQSLPEQSAQGVEHLFWKFSRPYKFVPGPEPVTDDISEYTRICDIGTRI